MLAFLFYDVCRDNSVVINDVLRSTADQLANALNLLLSYFNQNDAFNQFDIDD